MPENVLARIYEHNNWANQRLLEACSALTDEQLDADPPSATAGSLRRTLTHLVSSQRGYLALLTLPVEERPTTPVEYSRLRESARQSGEGLLALAKQAPGKEPQARVQARDGYRIEPWVVMLQAINHAGEHREQVCSMLTALGVTPPELDGWAYGEAKNALAPG